MLIPEPTVPTVPTVIHSSGGKNPYRLEISAWPPGGCMHHRRYFRGRLIEHFVNTRSGKRRPVGSRHEKERWWAHERDMDRPIYGNVYRLPEILTEHSRPAVVEPDKESA